MFDPTIGADRGGRARWVIRAGTGGDRFTGLESNSAAQERFTAASQPSSAFMGTQAEVRHHCGTRGTDRSLHLSPPMPIPIFFNVKQNPARAREC